MKENKLKVSFFTQAKRADKKGMVPLIGRIELGRKYSAFSAKKKVPLSLWDSRKQRLLGKSAIANSINQYLNECTALIHARYRELCESGESFTATDVRNAYQGQLCQNAMLLECYAEYLTQIHERVGIDRAMKTLELRTYQQTLLREYVRRKYKLSDIPLMELDISFIEGYEYFLTIDRKLKRGSICSALAALKAVVNKAVKNGMIDMYPFIGYSYEKTKGTPRNITQDDLQKIIDLPIKWEKYRVVRDLFVFSCFSGLAISDIRNLKEENIIIEEGKLCIKSKRVKTKTPFRVVVLSPAKTIMERYRGRRAGYVFDVPPKRRGLQCDAPHTEKYRYGNPSDLSHGSPYFCFGHYPVGRCSDRNRKRYVGTYQFENDTSVCCGQFRKNKAGYAEDSTADRTRFHLKIIAYGTQYIQDIVLH